MPYITALQRQSMDLGRPPHTAGELNYAITLLCHEYMARQKDPSYSDFNEVVGVLESAKLEFYRTEVAPYEDRKRRVNGPVLPR